MSYRRWKWFKTGGGKAAARRRCDDRHGEFARDFFVPGGGEGAAGGGELRGRALGQVLVDRYGLGIQL